MVGASTTALTPTPAPTPTPSPSPSTADGHPGVTGPGILITATVADDGAFEVTDAVRLPGPEATLAAAPPDLKAVGRGFQKVRPVVSGLTVRADDHRVSAPARVRSRVTLVAASAQTRWSSITG